jgi:hypothetical protein
MTHSEKIAIAAHLHVLLRRKTGRVTDTEWMAQDSHYAQEVVRFARGHAQSGAHPELGEWAAKLEQAMQSPSNQPHQPLLAMALARVRNENATPLARATTQAAQEREFVQSSFGDGGETVFTREGVHPARMRRIDEPRYIGGIR